MKSAVISVPKNTDSQKNKIQTNDDVKRKTAVRDRVHMVLLRSSHVSGHRL